MPAEAIGQAIDETFAAYGTGDLEGFVRHCAEEMHDELLEAGGHD